jgi:hypothetical protein
MQILTAATIWRPAHCLAGRLWPLLLIGNAELEFCSDTGDGRNAIGSLTRSSAHNKIL